MCWTTSFGVRRSDAVLQICGVGAALAETFLALADIHQVVAKLFRCSQFLRLRSGATRKSRTQVQPVRVTSASGTRRQCAWRTNPSTVRWGVFAAVAALDAPSSGASRIAPRDARSKGTQTTWTGIHRLRRPRLDGPASDRHPDDPPGSNGTFEVTRSVRVDVLCRKMRHCGHCHRCPLLNKLPVESVMSGEDLLGVGPSGR